MWVVLFDDAFEAEFRHLEKPTQRAIAAYAKLLATEGPQLGAARMPTPSRDRRIQT
jgi:hypothetical protein